MEGLPSEIILHITRFLEPHEIVILHLVSTKLLLLARDGALWRERCFSHSTFLETIVRRRELIDSEPTDEPRFRNLARALAAGNGLGDSRLLISEHEASDRKAQASERVRIMANWDPSYPTEKVDWYREFIARHSDISTSWFQQPRNRESAEREHLEVRGMGLYTPAGEESATLLVGPVDDGSVCIWDVAGTRGVKGSIIARSKAGLLSGPSVGSGLSTSLKTITSGVTECVSVDSGRKRVCIAVQGDLVEVDLETLSVASHKRFPLSISALSEAKHPVPLTIGTFSSLYLYDHRSRRSLGVSGDESVCLDSLDAHPSLLRARPTPTVASLLNPTPTFEYAHLHQPGPLSILHLPSSSDPWDNNGEIYVAGRFASILSYDRRYFPKLRGTIYSGARLSCLTSLPYPFASMEKDLARRGELSLDQLREAKTRPGKTLIACGEYNTKGSLEIYGLSPPNNSSNSSGSHPIQHSVMKNRQTSSSSKLLSVSTHGTRLVVSDGNGTLKWLERDGFTEVRRWNSSHGGQEAPRGIFGDLGDNYMDSGSGDIVIKLADTGSSVQGDTGALGAAAAAGLNDLVLWTGEKVGVLGFSRRQGFTADSFEEEKELTPEDVGREKEEKKYEETMRKALVANADEVRYMAGLGMQFGYGSS